MTNIVAKLFVVGKSKPKDMKPGAKIGYTFLNGNKEVGQKGMFTSNDVTLLSYYSETDYDFAFLEEVMANVEITLQKEFQKDADGKSKPTGKSEQRIRIIDLVYQPKQQKLA